MQVSDILEDKGSNVVAVDPGASISEVAKILSSAGIGAVVVKQGGEGLAGILSERDIVRSIAEHGEGTLKMTAADLMSRSVVTCGPDNNTADIMEQMMGSQIRHLPVVKNDALVGIISVSDVVKTVHGEMKWMTEVLQDQIATAAAWATDED